MKCKKCPGWEECPARNGDECVTADFQDLKKDLEMEHVLRVRLENINYELVREKQENDKKLKAVEIIKEKEVNVFIFLHSGDLETYNDMVEDNRKLIQEEYELLKEVLL